MLVYFLTIIAVALFSFLAIMENRPANIKTLYRKSPTQKVWLFFVALILICVAGLRYYVGVDYGAYYTLIKKSSLEMLLQIKNLDEPGFPLIIQLLKLFTTDGAVFIFLTSLFTLGSIIYINLKHTDKYLFVALLIIFTGVWDGTFNGVRQYFAAAIICLGHRFILDKKFWKYLICVLIASLFHSSAIIMIVPFFILRNKISVKNVLIMVIGSIILLYNYEFIFSFVGALKNETMDTDDAYMLNQVNILRVLANAAPAVFCLIIYGNVKKDKEQTFYLNVLLLYALLSVIGMNSPYLSRINIYLGVIVPLAMGKLIVFKDKNDEMIFKGIILLLFFVFWYYGVSTSDSLNVFRWIWQR